MKIAELPLILCIGKRLKTREDTWSELVGERSCAESRGYAVAVGRRDGDT